MLERKNKPKKSSKIIAILVVILFITLWITTLFFFSPQEIVEAIGIRNIYLIIFLLAAIGGLSSITGTTMFAAIATFASGGADPWLLGLIAGAGIFISDTVFFLLAQKGNEIFQDKTSRWSEKLSAWAKKAPNWAIRLGTFLYIGVSPLPNDILMIALAMARVSYSVLAPAILAGSISIATLAAHLGQFIF